MKLLKHDHSTIIETLRKLIKRPYFLHPTSNPGVPDEELRVGVVLQVGQLLGLEEPVRRRQLCPEVDALSEAELHLVKEKVESGTAPPRTQLTRYRFNFCLTRVLCGNH